MTEPAVHSPWCQKRADTTECVRTLRVAWTMLHRVFRPVATISAPYPSTEGHGGRSILFTRHEIMWQVNVVAESCQRWSLKMPSSSNRFAQISGVKLWITPNRNSVAKGKVWGGMHHGADMRDVCVTIDSSVAERRALKNSIHRRAAGDIGVRSWHEWSPGEGSHYTRYFGALRSPWTEEFSS